MDTDLQALFDGLAASERKSNGKAIHIGSAAAIAALCKAGVVTVRKFDATLITVYKNDAVYAAWKAARRVQCAPVPPWGTTGARAGLRHLKPKERRSAGASRSKHGRRQADEQSRRRRPCFLPR